MKANVVNAISITAIHYIGTELLLETTCNDFDDYKRLPDVVSYNGVVCGKTGWSSDRCYACYKSNALYATVR